ncbi:hypothetical protein FOZ60_012811 [Perkinsus olseni]|uniref:Uncharacterized protein n=1 Tax=Perkinsus olseni TaxID=32597 RepID=A0A7J6P986_PEROL|nr:hypothetical protein FOZ60_012811 [Perkinsus olseni]
MEVKRALVVQQTLLFKSDRVSLRSLLATSLRLEAFPRLTRVCYTSHDQLTICMFLLWLIIPAWPARQAPEDMIFGPVSWREMMTSIVEMTLLASVGGPLADCLQPYMFIHHACSTVAIATSAFTKSDIRLLLHLAVCMDVSGAWLAGCKLMSRHWKVDSTRSPMERARIFRWMLAV